MSCDTHREKPAGLARDQDRPVRVPTSAMGGRRQAAGRSSVDRQLLDSACVTAEPRWPVRLLATLVVLCIVLAGFVWWKLLSALP